MQYSEQQCILLSWSVLLALRLYIYRLKCKNSAANSYTLLYMYYQDSNYISSKRHVLILHHKYIYIRRNANAGLKIMSVLRYVIVTLEQYIPQHRYRIHCHIWPFAVCAHVCVHMCIRTFW